MLFSLCCTSGWHLDGVEFSPWISNGEENSSDMVSKYLDVSHVCVKTFHKTPFLRCDVFCMKDEEYLYEFN